MNLMNLVVALVAGLMLFEPFTRVPVSRAARAKNRGPARRAFVQAACALFAALMIVTSAFAPEHVSAQFIFGSAAVLGAASIYWMLRGWRLMTPRRMFAGRA
jgi:hydrogenase-4 membrane subunit HyfE